MIIVSQAVEIALNCFYLRGFMEKFCVVHVRSNWYKMPVVYDKDPMAYPIQDGE